MHPHDLFELETASQLPLSKFTPLYRLIFNRIYQTQNGNGLSILDGLITLFQQKGYEFRFGLLRRLRDRLCGMGCAAGLASGDWLLQADEAGIPRV